MYRPQGGDCSSCLPRGMDAASACLPPTPVSGPKSAPNEEQVRQRHPRSRYRPLTGRQAFECSFLCQVVGATSLQDAEGEELAAFSSPPRSAGSGSLQGTGPGLSQEESGSRLPVARRARRGSDALQANSNRCSYLREDSSSPGQGRVRSSSRWARDPDDVRADRARAATVDELAASIGATCNLDEDDEEEDEEEAEHNGRRVCSLERSGFMHKKTGAFSGTMILFFVHLC